MEHREDHHHDLHTHPQLDLHDGQEQHPVLQDQEGVVAVSQIFHKVLAQTSPLNIEESSYFISSLRVAERVCGEELLIKSFPPESYDIRNIEDSWAFLAKEGNQQKFEEYVREWMKNIYEAGVNILLSKQLTID